MAGKKLPSQDYAPGPPRPWRCIQAEPSYWKAYNMSSEDTIGPQGKRRSIKEDQIYKLVKSLKLKVSD